MLKQNIKLNLQSVSKSVSLPQLEQIRLKVNPNGDLIAQTTDLSSFVTTINKNIDAPYDLDVCVPAKEFSDVIGIFNDFEIAYDDINCELVFKSGRKKAKLRTFPSADFPNSPEIKGNKTSFVFDKKHLTGCFAYSSDKTRGILQGINFRGDLTGAYCAATDGYRLTFSKLDEQYGDFDFTIDGINTIKMLSSMPENEVEITFSDTSNFVGFKQGDVEFIVRKIEGKYPDYTKIIPKQFQSEIKVNRKDLISCVKEANVLIDRNTFMIQFEFKEQGKMSIKARSDNGDYYSEIDYSGDINLDSIAFNSSFLVQILQRIDSDIVVVKMNTDRKPAVFESSFESQSTEYLALLMPIMP